MKIILISYPVYSICANLEISLLEKTHMFPICHSPLHTPLLATGHESNCQKCPHIICHATPLMNISIDIVLPFAIVCTVVAKYERLSCVNKHYLFILHNHRLCSASEQLLYYKIHSYSTFLPSILVRR